MAKKRSASSTRWLKEHMDDEFVIRSKKEGWRSRAIYKLQEIDEKDRLFKPGMTVVDLGAAPGSWSQYAMHKVGHNGKVVGLDLLPIDPLAGVDFIQGDFRDDEVLEELLTILDGRKVDVVLSDMAPNMSGIKGVDQPKTMYLLELALDFIQGNLKPGGDYLLKVFQGEGFQEYYKALQQNFTKVVTRKPKASRARSAEIYLLAKGFKG
ncbi:23S rRNA (uridine(2552)-2'-O)-methyltransferase RlmE [Ignatzschineria ureiclastica]|uniref:Ribosomal RNA large subunit methyltransferase E n=1 Tax=Ignatzschineria ureiclastica TaxID=472582 RepID=A0A2U2ADL6_9GAMM|nr:23S rRNA (uridine(2552)-2'-O)-methyltransferase RlmE [Ignatzschineria ureiclastica]PWD80649.1 23S rRNA (uridine(2552)-2'-O)-methyltransferase RlmE [Ignatzschineria ureiclastica]GGZ95555.1 ribosomal RNA large subunit methyltransferase E [Ignatzschineria ureiclastica]